MNLKNITLKVLLYYILVYSLTGVIFILQLVFSINPLISLPQLAPGIIAIIFIVAIERKSVKDFIKLTYERKLVIKVCNLLIALFPIAAVLFAFFTYSTIYNLGYNVQGIDFIVIFWPFIGALFEEVGWRGYLLNSFGKKMNIINASIITGIFWYFWHIQFFQRGLIYALLAFLLIISHSVNLTYLYYNNNKSILLCYIYHLIENIMNYIFLRDFLGEEALFFFLIMPYVVLAVMLLVFKRKFMFSKASSGSMVKEIEKNERQF